MRKKKCKFCRQSLPDIDHTDSYHLQSCTSTTFGEQYNKPRDCNGKAIRLDDLNNTLRER